jgi:chemotaxis protein CheX
MPNKVNAQLLETIVKSIFTTMMDLPIDQSEAPWGLGGDRLTSIVYLEGDWNGAVSLECTASQACQFAGRFLSMDPPDAVDDDVRDVLGELANMIGGNVKSAMATGVRLSMPSVVDGDDYELRICGACVQDRLAFRFIGGDFWVTLVTKKDGVPMSAVHRSTAQVN